jgi:hypothetical protein
VPQTVLGVAHEPPGRLATAEHPRSTGLAAGGEFTPLRALSLTALLVDGYHGGGRGVA